MTSRRIDSLAQYCNALRRIGYGFGTLRTERFIVQLSRRRTPFFCKTLLNGYDHGLGFQDQLFYKGFFLIPKIEAISAKFVRPGRIKGTED